MGSRAHLLLASLALILAGCGPQPTRVVTFAPKAFPARTPTVGGSCWTHSIAAPARQDAWRCATGNRIEDPCFAVAGQPYLLCGANPAAPEQAHPVALALAQPLPHEPVPASVKPQPWLVELADGTLCRPFTGTRPLVPGHKPGRYACSSGSTIFGPLERHPGQRWTAQLRDRSVPVKSVWR